MLYSKMYIITTPSTYNVHHINVYRYLLFDFEFNKTIAMVTLLNKPLFIFIFEDFLELVLNVHGTC